MEMQYFTVEMVEELFRAGNDAGRSEPVGDEHDTVEAAVEAAGWLVLYAPQNTDGVLLALDKNNRAMGVGGDGNGCGAFAVDLTAERKRQQEDADRAEEQVERDYDHDWDGHGA